MSYLPGVYARRIWLTIAAAYVAGSLLGGLTLGVLAWALGTALRATALPDQGIVAVLLVLALVRDTLWRFPIPQRRVQVNPHGRSDVHPIAGAFIYGVSLGAGFLTFIAFASFYVLIFVVASQPMLLGALQLGAAYGLGRASFLLIVSGPAATPPRAGRLVRYLAQRRSAAALLSWLGAVILASFGLVS